MQEYLPGGAPALQLSPWWRFDQPAGCRGRVAPATPSLSLTASFDPLNDEGACQNLWQQGASGATSYQADTGPHQESAGGHAHITGAFAVAVGADWPPGTEWYSFRIVIDNRNTTGTGACAGCPDGAAFRFQYGEANSGNGGSNDARIDNPANGPASSCASWNNTGGINCQTATPARRATWGQVKSLYR